MSVVQRATSTECLNCGAVLTGPYCASCGQREPHTDVTLRELLHELAQELTQWEGRVPRTLKTLFFAPGLLTADFLAGRRARWLPPLRVYLICSVAYFVSGPAMEAITGRAPRDVARVTITSSDGSTTLTPEARRQVERGIPGRLFGVERLERAAADQARLNRVIRTAFPKAMFVLLPLFAVLTRTGWRRTMPRYPAHLYFALHVHAAWFGTLAASSIVAAVLPSSRGTLVIQLVLLGYALWSGLAAARRVFSDSWGRTIAKAAAIGVVYTLCLIAVSMLMLAYAVMSL